MGNKAKLIIEIAENGFVATTYDEHSNRGDINVFVTPSDLGEFATMWSVINKTGIEAIGSNEDDEWISVSDRLPTPGTRVKTKGGWCEVPDVMNNVMYPSARFDCAVTHWKPA